MALGAHGRLFREPAYEGRWINTNAFRFLHLKSTIKEFVTPSYTPGRKSVMAS